MRRRPKKKEFPKRYLTGCLATENYLLIDSASLDACLSIDLRNSNSEGSRHSLLRLTNRKYFCKKNKEEKSVLRGRWFCRYCFTSAFPDRKNCFDLSQLKSKESSIHGNSTKDVRERLAQKFCERLRKRHCVKWTKRRNCWNLKGKCFSLIKLFISEHSTIVERVLMSVKRVKGKDREWKM